MAEKSKKVFIATPMYGDMCTSRYTIGLIDSVIALDKNGFDVQFLSIGNESLITRARNELVRKFLETDAYYFLFIDADIGFKADDVFKLIYSDKDLICGLYPKKMIDWDRVDAASKQGMSNLKDYASSYVVNTVEVDDPDKPLISPVVEISNGGTGFMLITRTVFEHLNPHVKEYRISTLRERDGSLPPLVKEYFALDIVGEDKYLLSEDYFFCELWRKHGGKVYTDLSISLTHTGSYVYEGNLLAGGSNPR